ncbi:MAG: hypothetical protein AAGH38_06530 [Pseudomonadota bacterium]
MMNKPTFIFASAAVLTGGLVLYACGSQAMAQIGQGPQSGPASSSDDLLEIERTLEDYRREEARLVDEASAKAEEVEALRENLVETADALQSAERRIAELNISIAALEAEAASLQEDLRTQGENLSNVLAGLQKLERNRPPALLTTPSDAAEAARSAMLMADAAPQLKAKADELRLSLERLNETKQRLDTERDQKEQTNREVGARRTLLADLLKTKQEERSVAAKLAQAAQSETAALAARAETLRQVLRALDDFAREILPRLKPERSASRPVARPAPRLAIYHSSVSRV